jgi:hypothetical protein
MNITRTGSGQLHLDATSRDFAPKVDSNRPQSNCGSGGPGLGRLQIEPVGRCGVPGRADRRAFAVPLTLTVVLLGSSSMSAL